MKWTHWFVLICVVTGVVILSGIIVPRYMSRDTIRGIDKESFLKAASGVLSPTNRYFSADNISIKHITYINDTVAVANMYTKQEEMTVYVVFELSDNRIYVTNYASTHFLPEYFAAESDVVRRILNATDTMR